MIVVHEDQREEAASPIKRKIKVVESTHSNKRRKSCMSGELSSRKRRNSDSNGDR